MDVLKQLAAELPADLGAAVLVVLHVSGESALPSILSRAGPLPAEHAVDGAPLEPDRIYVAPPDRHLLVGRDRVRVVMGPHENGHRPAIDPLFRSAALAFGRRAVAVVLSGVLDDGAAGSGVVARHGGAVLVQDPVEAPFSSMPLNAIAADSPEAVLRTDRMGRVVVERVRKARSLAVGESQDHEDAREVELAALEIGEVGAEAPGERSPFSCPTCGGVLWKADDEDAFRFRCRVGHAFGAESLVQAQSESLENALWTALRALEERADLGRRMADRARARNGGQRALRYDRMVDEAEQSSRVLRELLAERGDAAVR